MSSKPKAFEWGSPLRYRRDDPHQDDDPEAPQEADQDCVLIRGRLRIALLCVVPDAEARSGDAGACVTLPAAVHSNTEARNAGADANATLPEVQANAGEQFQGAVESDGHIRNCTRK